VIAGKFKAKGILIDLDGTVVDSREAYREALTTALRDFGQTTVDDRLVTEIPKRVEQNEPLDSLLKGIDVRRFLETYLNAYYNLTLTRTKPMAGVSATLRKLSSKAKLGLVTMRCVPKERVIDDLERFNLKQYFQCVMTASDGCQPKPFPEAFVKCAERLGVKTSECLVVGDSVVDVRAGKRAGAVTVAVLSGIYSREELIAEKPDLIIESINELPRFLG
jgi:HAD superfamily hydrolase (TIGR01509 family)